MTAVMPLGLRRTGKDEGAEQIFFSCTSEVFRRDSTSKILIFLVNESVYLVEE